MRLSSLAILFTVVIANLALWALLNRPQPEVAWTGPIKGTSFSPFRADQGPLAARFPSAQQIDEDLALLASRVQKVRTYSSTDGFERIPALAQRHNLTVTAGAWLDKDTLNNAAEIANLIKNARQFRNIDRVIVGNEAVLRGDLSVAELAVYLRKVRKQVKVPVSTAEPWHVWIKHPELAKEVDFIAVHLLPYWEGADADQAIDFVAARYRELQLAFPGKPILIAEVGWPSDGNRRQHARADLATEAKFVRRFLNLADEKHYDYFIMEAFDQPWKRAFEGTVGAHWGLFDAARQEKFALSGPIVGNPRWPLQAAATALLALAPMGWFLLRWHTLRARGRLFYALLIQTVASALTLSASAPLVEDLSIVGTVAWAVLLPAQIALFAVILINGMELAEMSWLRSLRRTFTALPLSSEQALPKVSLHLAICNEPPELVIQTLDSLAALDYPDYEVLVIDNNTTDAQLWQPVADHCAALGPRFRFFTLGKWHGFKAGALNFALQQTAADAEIIGVVDSDYLVRRDWLKSLAPHFERREVAFVQAPQDHRGWEGDRFKEMINWEYAGFFHIGMVHRNERNAIIQHGTMTLIRKSALHEMQGWSEWCICEDAELGLRLLAQGYESVYVNEVFGKGLTPHSYAGYKGQRFRWAYGAVQILKAHWRTLWSGRNSKLSTGQRYHFLSGWLPWFSDGLHVVFTLAALLWTLGLLVLPGHFDFPLWSFLVPTLGVFAYKLLHGVWLYRVRVPCSLSQCLGAAVAGMSLTHTIGRAMLQGLCTSNQPFLRTPKAEDKPALVRGLAMAREELLILIALLVSACAVLAMYGRGHEEAMMWVAVLAVQAVPYAAALYCSLANVLPARLRRQSDTPEPTPSAAFGHEVPALPGSAAITDEFARTPQREAA